MAQVDSENVWVAANAKKKVCPAAIITISNGRPPNEKEMVYISLDCRNPLLGFGTDKYSFAWLGLAFFILPLLIAIIGGSKTCNRYCGRGQLFELLGSKLKLSLNHKPQISPKQVVSFRVLAFFMTMFGLMLFSTYKVFTGAPLKQTVTLLWTVKLPWQWADVSMVAPWFAQFAFGFLAL